MEMFNWYIDYWIDYGLFFFNSISYILISGLITYFLLFSLGSFSNQKYFNKNIYQSNYFILMMITAFLYYFNLKFDISLNIFLLFFLIFINSIFIYKNVTKKSLKYISIIFIFFIFCIELIYQYSLYKVVVLSAYIYDLPIDNIDYHFKSFFSIYEKTQDLFSFDYIIDGTKDTISNNTIFKRIYFTLYLLNSFVLSFWIFVYYLVLRKHKLI